MQGTVRLRGHTFRLNETADEVRGAVKADVRRDAVYGYVGAHQERLRLTQPQPVHVCQRRAPVYLFHAARQIRRVEMKAFFQRRVRDRREVVLSQI